MWSDEQQDVLIVGAGLSGLIAADALTRAHLSVLVLEARDRVGGRTLSSPLGQPDGAWIDLGGAWTRPHHTQARQLAQELGVSQFDQYVEGDGLLDLGPQGIERQSTPSPMVGATRFHTGAQSLTHALAARLPQRILQLNTAVTAIEVTADGVEVEVEVQRPDQAPEIQRLRARAVVVALPPRLIAGTLKFVPSLPAPLRRVLEDTPTWMGHSAKVFVRYRQAFWRGQQLSGFALSAVGPLEEIHDVSSPDQDLTALFGFLQGGPVWRTQTTAQRERAVVAQLARLFGPEALDYLSYHELDWVEERYTSSAADAVPFTEFPYGHELFETPALGGQVFWAGTETSAVAGGMLEGAIRAGRRAAHLVQQQLKS